MLPVIASGLSFSNTLKSASIRALVATLCWLIFISLLPAAAQAQAHRINLTPNACIAQTSALADVSIKTVKSLKYNCSSRLLAEGGEQIWIRFSKLELSPRQLASDQPRFLLINTIGFSDLYILTADQQGRYQKKHYTSEMAENAWDYGNSLKFELPKNIGPEDIYLGISGIGYTDVVKRAEIVDADVADALSERWLIISGLFLGAMIASLIYTLILLGGARQALHLIYFAWMAAATVYGLAWSGLIHHMIPGLSHIEISRIIYLSGIISISLNLLFFIGFFAKGQIPKLLLNTLRVFAYTFLCVGIFAALGQPSFLLASNTTVTVLLACAHAVTFIAIIYTVRSEPGPGFVYAIGWSFLTISIVMAVANFYGLMASSILIDTSATFATIIHALLISIATAIRTTNKRHQWLQGIKESERLRHLADTDVLTGLLNRRGFIARAQPLIAKQMGASLIVIDVDHFKDVNDRFGHDTGDKVLARLGSVITTEHKNSSLEDIGKAFAGRIGGEEFAVLLESPVEDVAITFADQLRRKLAGMDWSDLLEPGLGITISTGVVSLPASVATSFERLFVAADHALYTAKHRGRNRVEIATIEDIRRVNARLATVN